MAEPDVEGDVCRPAIRRGPCIFYPRQVLLKLSGFGFWVEAGWEGGPPTHTTPPLPAILVTPELNAVVNN